MLEQKLFFYYYRFLRFSCSPWPCQEHKGFPNSCVPSAHCCQNWKLSAFCRHLEPNTFWRRWKKVFCHQTLSTFHLKIGRAQYENLFTFSISTPRKYYSKDSNDIFIQKSKTSPKFKSQWLDSFLLFTRFNIGWEIWLRQTLKTNKTGTSFSNM